MGETRPELGLRWVGSTRLQGRGIGFSGRSGSLLGLGFTGSFNSEWLPVQVSLYLFPAILVNVLGQQARAWFRAEGGSCSRYLARRETLRASWRLQLECLG